MAAKKLVCFSCGFENNPAGSERCVSCGARLEGGGKNRDAGLDGYQQEGLSLTWLLLSICIQGILTAAIIFVLPKAVTALDFEGGNGMTLCIPIWFGGGFIVGVVSPARTYIEPVVASLIVALPATFILVENQTVRTLPTFLYMIMAAIGILFTLIGSYLGDRARGRVPATSSSSD